MISRPASLALALLLGGTFLVPRAAEAKVVVVLSAELAPYQDALAGLKESVPDATSVLLKDGQADVGAADVVVALGGQAALADYPSKAGLVVAMVADPKVKPSRKHTRVTMLSDANVLFSKIKAIQPGISKLAAFGVESSYDGFLKALGAAAAANGAALVTKKVNKIDDLVGALRGMNGAEALWIPPDPLLVNPDTFKLMSGFCTAGKVGLYAPATGLAKFGALAGVAPSFKEIGRAAGRAAASLEGGSDPGASVDPSKSEVMINATTAKAIGLAVPAGAGQVIQ